MIRRGGGLIFPDSYGGDPPDGPDGPEDGPPFPVHLVESRGPCGCSSPHHDLEGYDRRRDDAADDRWERLEREALDDERRAQEDDRW